MDVSAESNAGGSPKRRLRLPAFLVLCWTIVISSGFGVLARYEATPGAALQAPEKWPADVELLKHAPRARLVMFAHPRCPCTRASLAELERLLAHVKDVPETAVVFLQPDHASDDWSETANQRQAAAIPGVQVVRDVGGELAHRFGAATSGHVLFYDPERVLRFSGGITASRGQEGSNPASETLAAWLQPDGPAAGESPHAVYGCPLFNAGAACPAEGTTCPQP